MGCKYHEPFLRNFPRSPDKSNAGLHAEEVPARQANDVVPIGAFAVFDDALAGKARVAAKHNEHLGPALALAQALKQ